ncbi:MAG: NAD(P)H-dependent oxidoreductase [Candidatus Omnitrophica bacterium]|nr:NAD(P)H-dependent oxidoreductase [Candidatus Omnitrophota bacterium]
MKVAIVFYSFSGNTKRAAMFLHERFTNRGVQCAMVDLRPEKEEKSFIKQSIQAFFKKEVLLERKNKIVSEYDFIIFGSPVWAFTIAPALRAFLANIADFNKQKTACFLTYGSGLGKEKALSELERQIKEKGGHILFSRNLKGGDTKRNSYLNDQFNSLLEMVDPTKNIRKTA